MGSWLKQEPINLMGSWLKKVLGRKSGLNLSLFLMIVKDHLTHLTHLTLVAPTFLKNAGHKKK